MSTIKEKPINKETNFFVFFGRIFWQVFTLPFRAVRLVYRKVAAIPIKHLIFMALIAIGLGVITVMLFVKVTSQPEFCVTCHYMKPYFASWEESSHKDIYCTECHFPPGVTSAIRGKFTAVSMLVNYWTGVYRKSKPWAEVSDESCLRNGCHQTRLLEGQVPFKEGIVFDHTHHLTEDRRGKTLRCTSCHSQIVQGSHMTVTEETCFLCHFKDQPEGSPLTFCTRCHEAPVASDNQVVIFDHADMVAKNVNCRLCHGEMKQGDGDVPNERCSYCHAEVGRLNQYSQTTKIHQIHITEHKVECNHCHNTISHQSIARTGDIKPECQACHIDRHNVQYNLFSGQGANGVDPLPSSMFHAGLGCKACHVILPEDWHEHPGKSTRKAGPASCTPCHEEAYYKLYHQAKPILSQRIASVENRIKAIQIKKPGANAQKIIARTVENINLLKSGKPIHNLNYTDRILQEANRSLDLIEGKTPPPKVLPDTTSEQCIRCHYGQDEVVVAYENKSFSHRNHVHNVKLGCATCHIEEKPLHGALRKGSYCMDCHHKSAAVSCEPCHHVQRNLIQGEGLFREYEPDIMFEVELTCRDCHDIAGIKVNKPTAKTCEACHEPGYWEAMAERQDYYHDQVQVLIRELNNLKNAELRQTGLNLIAGLEADGTKGAHNPAAAIKALDTVQSLIKTVQTTAK